MMLNQRLYHCPYTGCSQTSTRRWNMNIHIMRKHGGRHAEVAPKTGSWSVPNSQLPSFSPNYREPHAYEIPHHPNTFTDFIEKTEILQDEFLESFRKFNEANRLMNEFALNSTPESSLSGKLANCS